MADENVHKAGFTRGGIKGGSTGSEMMSKEARSHGGGVPSGGPTSTLQEMGAKSSTHSSGFTLSGISSGTEASGMMSQEAKSHGGETPKGGTTSTVQSVSMGGKGK
ncbi:interferon alpha-inducible protein 27, mitochondrial-like [Mauremys reevesii]|uniref:interferon alpha-inducible protein 27, mitochondrial-like n=1 Tax=Mauremys reevesii TaxID=260615 RepID=UPI00193F64FF|nr:interferon alpha-inducible protein 27, mitochondrial-like [Mauremys reevesii]